MFKLFSSNTKNASANEELVAVTLKEGTAKAPFSKVVPLLQMQMVAMTFL